ncbi:MAG: hypothetical protein A4E65_00068 [Syntrophorhabdus sp. PtaU1.Bin153]|nr:MAG: hypothetical protein A4E65_00068 [Syntrophorhabdus sp. PtaU1.Bin153]
MFEDERILHQEAVNQKKAGTYITFLLHARIVLRYAGRLFLRLRIFSSIIYDSAQKKAAASHSLLIISCCSQITSSFVVAKIQEFKVPLRLSVITLQSFFMLNCSASLFNFSISPTSPQSTGADHRKTEGSEGAHRELEAALQYRQAAQLPGLQTARA